ncbi:hypothetical protein Sviol_51260 [Streptomyces violascens]|uniref:Uncharacterized protein n=1 Tax=Streptomyces violascens TaxID=67381 RepID=A0ABQ3QTV5_9ACTN|nr:hypothetical protein Sviol_51260 [Streptomyces violascens]
MPNLTYESMAGKSCDAESGPGHRWGSRPGDRYAGQPFPFPPSRHGPPGRRGHVQYVMVVHDGGRGGVQFVNVPGGAFVRQTEGRQGDLGEGGVVVVGEGR